MTKKLTIPEGNLLRVAAKKGITTLSALYDKTEVDRKALRTINRGQPYKEMTLQTIADKLHIPLDHFLGPSTLDEIENSSSTAPYHQVSSAGYHCREIKLQQLDTAALRRIAGQTARITWLLKIDQMTDSLEATLLKLRASLLGWYEHLNRIPPDFDTTDNLVDQISSIRTSADIDKSVEQLTAQNLKIYGGTYVQWNKEQARHRVEDYPLPILRYTSRTEAELCIAPEEKNNSTTTRVATGYEPPQKFIESELAGIDFVDVNYRQVWSRSGQYRFRSPEIDEIPF